MSRMRSPRETGRSTLGMRGDFYNGLAHRPASGTAGRSGLQHQGDQHGASRFLCPDPGESFQREPRYCQHRCSIPFLAALVPPPGVPCVTGPITPGYRNEFHAGLQQAFGKYLVVSGDYIWKYTHNGYDFGTCGQHSDYLPD